MKNLLSATIILVLLVSAGSVSGQSIEKGNLIGVHTVTVDLDPDVTMNEYRNFILTKWIPATNKNFPGMKTYLAQGVRGTGENSLGFIFVFKSEADRDQYFNEDGSQTEARITADKKMQSTTDEGNKLGTWTSTYTDWVVQ